MDDKTVLDEDKFLKSISLIRFPLIILVVFIHTIEIKSVNFELDNLFNIVSTSISHNLGSIAVPCFFIISGYLFVLKLNDKFSFSFYKKQLSNRIHTLLIPYLIWNAVLILSILLKNYIFSQIGLAEDDFKNYLINNSIYEIIWGYPINYPLWYLRDLIIMVILSPILFYIGKTHWGIIVLYLYYLLQNNNLVSGFSSTAIFYFSFGIWIRYHFSTFKNLLKDYKYILMLMSLIMLLSLSFYYHAEYYNYLTRIFTLIGSISLFALFYNSTWRVDNQKLNRINEPIFFIYATHIVYIINWIKGGFSKIQYLNTNEFGKIITYFCIPICTVVVCIFMYYTLKKIFPRALKLSVGGR